MNGMFVCTRKSGEEMTTTPAQRIGGWLLGPLARLLVALLSASLAILLYVTALATPQTFQTLGEQSATNLLLWGVSFITAIAMWYYTLWLTIAFFKRRRCVPKHYILWLLISVLLAIKAFAFSPGFGCLCRPPATVPVVGCCIAGALFQAFAAREIDVCEPVITLQLTCCRLL